MLPTSPAFLTVDQAWIDTLREIDKGKPLKRPFLDVFEVVERLYQRQRICQDDLWVMQKWGRKGEAPDQYHKGEARIWRLAMVQIEGALREKGIVW